ncbi:MAG: citrate/2-methylcitrate synthase [Candidatus Krumholzibacteriota bacterium]
MVDKVKSSEGMLYYIIEKIRPRLAERIRKTGRLETMIVGLGRQGRKHAGLMKEFGTVVAAGVAPNKGGARVQETIPVYNTAAEALEEHPDIAAASIWRHYTTAGKAALEVIEAGVPLVVLITEFIPLRDVRDILVAAREHNTLLIGGNTPGIIFPPERIKIGMLPDIFAPEEKEPGVYGAGGVSIISRSGAILYHMSDAMASAGISQNAVIGVGGDGAIGSTFKDLVPLMMGYEKTDLVVVAGEIGGCQEEELARDIGENPEKYPKPVVALISGAHAPEGKTMGHAGAIVTPGRETGTYRSKKEALESAGVKVVNSQFDLITAVKDKLGGRTYFDPESYFKRMRQKWEEPMKKPTWGTMITRVEPDNLVVRGYRLQDIIRKGDLISAAWLIVEGDLPDPETAAAMKSLFFKAAGTSLPEVPVMEGEDISRMLAKYMLCDESLYCFSPEDEAANARKTVYALGRLTAYLAEILGNLEQLKDTGTDLPASALVCAAVTGRKDEKASSMIEAMIVASIDHGVTPPSAQATLIAASVRADYEVSVSHGIGAITDVHGGAGEKAAAFFRQCSQAEAGGDMDLEDATRKVIKSYIEEGRRIQGMGHRIHSEDPRRDALWERADQLGISSDCVTVSRMVRRLFKEIKGMDLPVNVDGVIGAIIADMGIDSRLAKALFVFGRVCGLSAHYFEEIITQPGMRRIVFGQAEYKGEPEREYPESG